ncbi:DNA mismatch repair endonuclease MutL [Spongiivirga citrea]|uniref:DNA mismatch repair protein MutL n=1 Tax=Spongiivirga citrea TaxID=1481457 RepID=A0A6M0CD92_9FLAO|nr:DNA mismatch repair endonuclease MutL [Spongiivirga citrea]NER15681.1 DNA mismatch repair endonuclease MutL [Spongiivirga citrea]
MADIIQLLPDHVANQIAAGEVVQRPASVVKELMENAIDAEATLVKLIIKEAGKTLIQVVDNGVGMSETDARLSFERHATSKIRQAEDLFSLNTKGFRGEALASIAAIAHVEMTTRPENRDVATQIKIEGSKVNSQEIVAAPKGTAIAVKNLFYNIPARRNFLKSNQVELRHIIDEFQRVALAHPNIAFNMYHNGAELFNLPVSNHRQRIVGIFGPKTNEKLVPVDEETDLVTITGFVGKPDFAKKSRGEQFFFVNDRFIKSPYLNHAINNAFDGLLKDKVHPSYFLYLSVNPKSIDINIHPTKTEIKFDDEHALYAILRSAVKHSLGQFNVAPVLDFDRDATMDTPYSYQEKKPSNPSISVDANFNPFAETVEKNPSVKKHTYRKADTASWESLYVGVESKSVGIPIDFNEIELESDEVTGSLFEQKTKEDQSTTYQLHNKYLVSKIKSGMLIIDQNRAHQRVLYEKLLEQMTLKGGISQQLLFPLSLDFSTADVALIASVKENLENTGFIFSKMEGDTVEITGIPFNITESQVRLIIDQLLSDFQNEVPDAIFSQVDLMAKSIAKSTAIKTGMSLSVTEQESLVNDLFACKEPTLAPDNRPAFITISMDELERKFL